jgi:hypothetical protein
LAADYQCGGVFMAYWQQIISVEVCLWHIGSRLSVWRCVYGILGADYPPHSSKY